MIIHIFDNIDWNKNNVQRTETHHANSILVKRSEKINLELFPSYSLLKHSETYIRVKYKNIFL